MTEKLSEIETVPVTDAIAASQIALLGHLAALQAQLVAGLANAELTDRNIVALDQILPILKRAADGVTSIAGAKE